MSATRKNPSAKIKIVAIDHHRNGIGGAPFYAVIFTAEDYLGEKDVRLIASVFEERGHVAVFDVDLLSEGTVAFAENSWRGDFFEEALRKAIRIHEHEQEMAYANQGGR